MNVINKPNMKNALILFNNQNKRALDRYHYIRKADPDNNYWLDFTKSKMDDIIMRTHGSFYIGIAGSEIIVNDFYLIPYNVVSHLFKKWQPF